MLRPGREAKDGRLGWGGKGTQPEGPPAACTLPGGTVVKEGEAARDGTAVGCDEGPPGRGWEGLQCRVRLRDHFPFGFE